MNRRDFLKGATLTSLGMTIAGTDITALGQGANSQPANQAPAKVDDELKGAPVNFAVIGLGQRGREILTSLSQLAPFAPVVVLCDKYTKESFVKKAQAIAPSATFEPDYKKVLDNKQVQ